MPPPQPVPQEFVRPIERAATSRKLCVDIGIALGDVLQGALVGKFVTQNKFFGRLS